MAISARKQGQRLTVDDFQRLVELYRASPGQHFKVGSLFGMDWKTAKRFWEGASPKHYPWARPIKDLVLASLPEGASLPGEEAGQHPEKTPPPGAPRGSIEEREVAEELARRTAADQEAQALARAEAERERLRAEAAKIDDQVLRLLRSNALANVASLAKISQALVRVGDRKASELENPARDENGHVISDLSVGDFVSAVAKLSSASRSLALTAEAIAVITSQREPARPPVAATGAYAVPATLREVSAEMERVQRALERARREAAEQGVVDDEDPIRERLATVG